MSAEAYPLQWPDGWPRTHGTARQGDQRFGGRVYGLAAGRTRQQLLLELSRLGARDVVVSSNVPLRQDGQPFASHRSVEDPGVAVYFTLRKRPLVMARDAYTSVVGNMRSLTLAIMAMRQLERHGGSLMMERAFTGFAAITPPDWKKPWRQVFGVPPDWIGDVRALYREKVKVRHPDVGGDHSQMAELNVAYGEALRELAA